jgi:tRNA-modifying protein YgfZ
VTSNFCARLEDRGVVSVRGPDAQKLLQGILTNDLDVLNSQEAVFAGLLSPQGKVLFDFFVSRDPPIAETAPSPETFLIDVAREHTQALMKRLTLYKLRAKAEISDESERLNVLAMWGSDPCFICLLGYKDPRLAALGLRGIGKRQFVVDDMSCSNGTTASSDAYHAHRIALGVPEGGKDYTFGDAFPHEALFDQLHGVSFTKGCYVGQEIVARMEHRGTARKRIVPVEAVTTLPAPGTDIKAGEITIGSLGSSAGSHGLALLRLDRVAEFAAKGVSLTAGDATLRVTIPSWASFALPAPDAQTGTP